MGAALVVEGGALGGGGFFFGCGLRVLGHQLIEEGLALGGGESGCILIGFRRGFGLGAAQQHVEDMVDVGGVICGRETVGFDEMNERAGGAEAGEVVGAVELEVDGADGFGDGEAKISGEIVPKLLVTAIEFGDEDWIVVLPAIEGGGVDLEVEADIVIGLAGDEHVEGGAMPLGEVAGGGVKLGGGKSQSVETVHSRAFSCIGVDEEGMDETDDSLVRSDMETSLVKDREAV